LEAAALLRAAARPRARLRHGLRARRRRRLARGVRRWLRRLAIGLLLIVIALTVAAGGYDLATAGRDRPETKLYRGPFVEADGKLVAYRRWGSRGSPILLVGGFAEASWVWNRVGPLLARRHRVVAIDLPPFGYSER